MDGGTSFFGDLLGSIAERGRSLLDLGRERRPAGAARAASVTQLCERLLSGRGEASGVALAQEILAAYGRLRSGERIAFFETLATSFGPDAARLDKALAAYAAAPDARSVAELHAASEPRRQELIRRFNLAPGATARLVAMRADLIGFLPRRRDLAEVDRDFTHLFASWFNRGFLVLRRIDWSTPANVLEKIIRYEAVHEIRDWNDLRARVDSPDRRCYAFFHPALVDEPLIFVEVALTREAPFAIAPILATGRTPLAPEAARTAVFYSISNCQTGLGGVSFGNFLIKQVVAEISREFPNLREFVTLSPVPGFRGWLEAEIADPASAVLTPDDRATLALFAGDEPPEEAARDRLRPVIEALAAHYFLIARSAKGKPLDPVARFHLGNGARLERINPFGDLSRRGMAQAFGLMVNYRYLIEDIEKNHEAFFDRGTIVASAPVRKLLRHEEPPRQPALREAAGR
ncbi:malonyl-CoA decarboxylase [Ancylobacter dichloromethanicus]|uniref:Decarboxylase n=1 Tax=Ancylobacter dichloromethanicus TaxID=518825 RepID=A0A9W6MYD9_9HYPH|nr:malonyl-CoA decarboxylase [Ancylobacter dichloromethanicus]MBS7553915.1 malonyl-CoA decarboxylase [Ancylobacter dichloromethanicus]GLK71023.1 decarboxylase [Ancylobacter dichloromethanicus]